MKKISTTLIVILSIILFTAFAYISQTNIKNTWENEIVYEKTQIEALVTKRTENILHKLQSLYSFVISNKDVEITEDSFMVFAESTVEDVDGVLVVSLAVDGIQTYVYPLEGNEDVLGHNLLTDQRESVQTAIEAALSTKEPQISGPYPSRTNPEINIMVFRYPVFNEDGSFYGLINMVVKTDMLFFGYNELMNSSIYDVEIVSNDGTTLYGVSAESDYEDHLETSLYDWTIKLNIKDSYIASHNSTKLILNVSFLLTAIILISLGSYFILRDRKSTRSIEHLVYFDFLTGLHNRRYYEEKLVQLDSEENLPITICMADINGLKLINDAFGHGSGDELLISASKVISNYCRETDIIARIGGDEFVVIMPKTTYKEAEKIIKQIKDVSNTIKTQSISLSISFGYKTKISAGEDIQEIYRSAEDLMYREKLLEIPSMRSRAVETILNTLYEKDIKSEVHSRTVAQLSERLAKACGMNGQDIAEVKTAGLLHDIGKIIIPISIISKEGKLTKDEYEIMKTHSEIGFRILNSTQDMRSISNIVLNHHERWDGGGYPRGIKDEEIPFKSRIICIADAFDAMTSERTYRKSISNEKALKELLDNAGTQFDPDLVQIFEKHFIDIIKE